MGYRINIDPKLQAVCLTHDGEVDVPEMNAARADLAVAAEAQGFKRMLVDASSMTVQPSITEQFEFVSKHPVTLPPGVRLAIVMRPALFRSSQFSEQVSLNRGVNMRIFDSLSAAKLWLGS